MRVDGIIGMRAGPWAAMRRAGLAAVMAALLLPGAAPAQDMGVVDLLGDAIDGILGAISDPAPTPPSDPPVISATEATGLNALMADQAQMPGAAALPVSHMPVVVELFTSQGCSNCLPADAMIADLSRQPEVLTLTFHVDYWDYLGWPDSFARPQFSARQKDYARASGERSVYTPQVIVAGTDTAVSLRPAELMALVDAHHASPAMLNLVSRRDGARRQVELQPLSDLHGPLAVLLVGYVPQRTVTIAGGENVGRTISYGNVVVGLSKLADWDGRQPLRLTVTPGQEARPDLPADTRSAVLVQQMLGKSGLPGPIMAAMRLE